jgi:hypothetical protein
VHVCVVAWGLFRKGLNVGALGSGSGCLGRARGCLGLLGLLGVDGGVLVGRVPVPVPGLAVRAALACEWACSGWWGRKRGAMKQTPSVPPGLAPGGAAARRRTVRRLGRPASRRSDRQTPIPGA